jgi:ribosomal protein S18 acetylase RimI-like enzyme
MVHYLSESRNNYFLTEILGFQAVDRYVDKLGKITDLLLNPISFVIEYFHIQGKKDRYIVPTSLINNKNWKNKTIRISQLKILLLKSEYNLQNLLLNHLSYKDVIKKLPVYDLNNNLIGNITDLIYHPCFKVELLITSKGSRLFKSSYYIVPTDCIDHITKDSMKIDILAEKLTLIDSKIQKNLFDPDVKESKTKKRYVIVEAINSTVQFNLSQKDKNIDQIEQFFIKPLDSAITTDVIKFTNMFNQILAASPDTYIPISNHDVTTYFSQGVFIAYQYEKPAGYCFCTIQKEEGLTIGSIAGIGVLPERRGNKISLALIDHAIDYLITEHVDKIQADIYEKNEPSLKLFYSLGFREIGDVFLT